MEFKKIQIPNLHEKNKTNLFSVVENNIISTIDKNFFEISNLKTQLLSLENVLHEEQPVDLSNTKNTTTSATINTNTAVDGNNSNNNTVSNNIHNNTNNNNFHNKNKTDNTFVGNDIHNIENEKISFLNLKNIEKIEDKLSQKKVLNGDNNISTNTANGINKNDEKIVRNNVLKEKTNFVFKDIISNINNNNNNDVNKVEKKNLNFFNQEFTNNNTLVLKNTQQQKKSNNNNNNNNKVFDKNSVIEKSGENADNKPKIENVDNFNNYTNNNKNNTNFNSFRNNSNTNFSGFKNPRAI
jgi:hypothetical protein